MAHVIRTLDTYYLGYPVKSKYLHEGTFVRYVDSIDKAITFETYEYAEMYLQYVIGTLGMSNDLNYRGQFSIEESWDGRL